MQAGRLISVKVFRDDLEAYGQLKILRDNRDIGTMPEIDPFTGKLNWMDEKSEAIVSFALCGFGNFGSIAIFLGAISKHVTWQSTVCFERYGAHLFLKTHRYATVNYVFTIKIIFLTGIFLIKLEI